MVSENLWNKTTDLKAVNAFCEDYKAFLSACKTERECVSFMEAELQAKGYRNLEDVIREGAALKAGDKVYTDIMKKALLMFHIGSRPLSEGMRDPGGPHRLPPGWI